jgi:hypothetical protein
MGRRDPPIHVDVHSLELEPYSGALEAVTAEDLELLRLLMLLL